MIISQLGKVTGVPVDGNSALTDLGSFLHQLDRVHAPTLMLAIAVLVFLLVAGRLWPRLAVPLIAVLLATGAVVVFSLADHGIQFIGTIPAGLPTPGLPDVSVPDVTALLRPAIGVAVVGYSDNVLTARSLCDP